VGHPPLTGRADTLSLEVIDGQGDLGPQSPPGVGSSRCQRRRVAQAFDLGGTSNKNGCPVLRALCEGRVPRTHAVAQPRPLDLETRSWSNPRSPWPNRAMQTAGLTSNLVQAASYPPLQKAQGRGTQNSGTGRKNTERAGHPPIRRMTRRLQEC
jgi:hypothetical protein